MSDGKQPCERCGKPTDETTLEGEFRCRGCQKLRRQEKAYRDVGQDSLDDYATDGGRDVDGVLRETVSLEVAPALDLPGDYTVTVEIQIGELLDDGRLVFWRDGSGWDGLILEEGRLKYVNQGAQRVMEKLQSVEEAEKRIQAHIDDPIAGGKGRFERGATPP